jgi:hypothetical protein
LTLGGVMLSVNGALSWLHFHDLTTASRCSGRRPESVWLPGTCPAHRLRLRLQALAGMLAALDSVGVSLFQTQAGNALLRQHFDSYWPVLQLDLGHRFAAGLCAKRSAAGDLAHRALDEWTGYARRAPSSVQERAMHWTRCEEVCTQFAAAPILSAGRVAGAVVLGSSLADVVVSFHRLSGADLGVLIPAGRPGAARTLLPAGWVCR